MTHPTPPVIPGFTQSSYLGSGGFADVFQYRHRTGAAYAVKVWRREYADDAWAQLQVEARALGRLASFGNHPNIIAPQPPSLVNGRPYLIMEFCPDGSLAGKGPMPVADVIRVGIQMCGALETAHLHDVLHCDVKPANILLGRDGTAKLSDFGIAEPVAASGESSGVMLTPQYSAPEVDAAGETSPLSDVYALAASLFELLTGVPPFRDPDGDNGRAAIEERKRRDEIPRIGRADVPPELERLLRFALRASVEARSAVIGPGGDSGPAAVFGTELRRVAAIRHDEPTAMVVYRPAAPMDAPIADFVPAHDGGYEVPSFDPAPIGGSGLPAADDIRTQVVEPPRSPAGADGQTVDRTIRRLSPAADGRAQRLRAGRLRAGRTLLVAGSAVLIAAAVGGLILSSHPGSPAGPVSTPSATLPADDPNLQAFVPTPTVTSHRLTNGSVVFEWTYQPVDPGDTYVVTRLDVASQIHQTVKQQSVTIAASKGEHPCIEVIVVRTNGRSSATAGRACSGG